MSDNFDDFLAAPLSTPSRKPSTSATRDSGGHSSTDNTTSTASPPKASSSADAKTKQPPTATTTHPLMGPGPAQPPQQQGPSRAATEPSPLSASTPSSGNSAPQSSGSFIQVPQNSHTTTQQQSHATVSPFSFKVGQAVMGQETIRPITYFPIKLTLTGDVNSGANGREITHNELAAANYPLTLPLPMPQAPQQRHVPQVAGQRRCRWDADRETNIERRYSELNDLRRLLVLQFPMRVIPPVVSKSSTDNLNTYMQSQAHLRQQQRNLNRFLREVVKMPEVMLFDDVVPGFFLFPRDKFVPWVGKARDMLSLLQSANASIEEHRSTVALSPIGSGMGTGGSGGLASDAAAVMTSAAAEGSKMIKNVAAAFSSWYSGNPSSTSTSASRAGAGGGSTEQRAAFQQKILAVYHRSSEIALWNDYERLAMERRKQIVDAADLHMRYIAASDEVLVALRDVAGALGDFHNVLSTSEGAFQVCSKAAACEQDFFLGIASSHEEEPDKNYVHVYEALLFESQYLEAMEDAAQFMKCLWYRRYEIEADPFAPPSDVSEWQRYVGYVHENLKKDMDRKLVAHVGRLKTLVQKNRDISMSSLVKEEEASSRSALLKLIRDPEYSKFV